MSQKLKNKIEASDTSIKSLLKDKFYIDYFQREYRWEEKHIKLLVDDLTSTFLKSYDKEDKRSEISNYQNYYLGPVVFSVNPDDAKKSIIDGQQRITSITLFLIYLNHLQADNKDKVSISDLVFSAQYGEKSFNMTDESREPCLKALFEEGEFKPHENDDETVKNMVERYNDISQSFPEELSSEALPYFIDWLIENVVIVQIMAYSDENAYTIFETMNDRGLNLTPTEMLKGYVLSRISDIKERTEINDIWKVQIQKLHEYDETADQGFFQAWFRGKYAESMRPGKAGAKNQDFELIGSKFHSWFKDNHKEVFGLRSSDDFYKFFKLQFPFFVKWYTSSWDSMLKYNSEMPHVRYIETWGIAESLQDPLLLSAIKYGDNDSIVTNKTDFIARFIETFTVRRSINNRKFGQATIKYTMFNLMKKIRNKDIDKLSEVLVEEIDGLEQKWEGLLNFRLHGQNRKFVKHLLCRITSHIDSLAGKNFSYVSYHHPPKGKPFEIEHIWADKFDEHKDEFDHESDFSEWRNSIGALVLLPNGTNQSFNSDKYEDKLEHYLKENTYAQTLHHNCYAKNPNFLNSGKIKELKFKAHPEFKTEDIEYRDKLAQRICEQIWATDYFNMSNEKMD